MLVKQKRHALCSDEKPVLLESNSQLDSLHFSYPAMPVYSVSFKSRSARNPRTWTTSIALHAAAGDKFYAPLGL